MLIKHISQAMLKLIAQTANHPLSAAAVAGVGPHASARTRRRLAQKRRR